MSCEIAQSNDVKKCCLYNQTVFGYRSVSKTHPTIPNFSSMLRFVLSASNVHQRVSVGSLEAELQVTHRVLQSAGQDARFPRRS